MDNKPHFLLINPPIYDFAAYDLWTKPVGLLYLSSIFKGAGADVSLIDCLDRGHPLMPESKNGKWGCGRYYSELTEKPGVLKGVPRKYSRFGLPKEGFIRLLKQTAVPDVIFVTSV